jgi:cell division protein FtsL
MTTTGTVLFVIGFAIICFLVGVIIYLERQLRDARQEIMADESIIKMLENRIDVLNIRIKKMLDMREGVK